MPCVKAIGLVDLEKKIFKNFTICGHGGHLGHVTWIKYTYFLSPFAWRLHMKLLKFGPTVSEEKSIENADNLEDSSRRTLLSYTCNDQC